MALRATSLGPKPSFLLFFVFLVFFVFCCFWRVKGQVRWPLGPKPSLFVFVAFLFCFLFLVFCFVFWLFNTKKSLVFP